MIKINKIYNGGDLQEELPGKKLEIKDIFGVNSYGNKGIDPLKKKEIYLSIPSIFCDFFISQGYLIEESVSISSDIDSSVFFIGSTTSVLKPYLLNGTIPKKGICMKQPSLRTHNTKHLKNDNPIRRGSTFTSIACMSNYYDGQILLKDTINFLLNILKIPVSNIAINISSKDTDLLELLKSVSNPIALVFDTKDSKYYTHRYGLVDIKGRNFNFVLKDEKSGLFNDIGNYIIIEDNEKKILNGSLIWK